MLQYDSNKNHNLQYYFIILDNIHIIVLVFILTCRYISFKTHFKNHIKNNMAASFLKFAVVLYRIHHFVY